MKEGDIVVVKKNGLLGEITEVYEPDKECPWYSYEVTYIAYVLRHEWNVFEANEIVLESLFDSKLYKMLY